MAKSVARCCQFLSVYCYFLLLKLLIRTDKLKEMVDLIFSIVGAPHANYLILALKYNYHARTRLHLPKHTTSPELGLQSWCLGSANASQYRTIESRFACRNIKSSAPGSSYRLSPSGPNVQTLMTSSAHLVVTYVQL